MPSSVLVSLEDIKYVSISAFHSDIDLRLGTLNRKDKSRQHWFQADAVEAHQDYVSDRGVLEVHKFTYRGTTIGTY